jgi:CBS domain-containing protein
MQMVSEVMTRDVRFVMPQESLQRAAQMMDDLNVGVLPVCDGERLVGMVTDRDITVRATSAGAAPDEACVEEVMSTDVRWCFEDQSLDEVMQQMADAQIRRVPVVSHDDAHKLIGIVALGDLATRTPDDAKKQDVEQVVEKVSSPSEPDRSRQSGNASASGGDINAAAGAGAAGGTGLGTAASADARTTGSTDPAGTGAPGGTDAAGATGATGGTAGTAGSTGTGIGARP